MNKTRAAITAVAKYLPERVLSNTDLEKMVETNDEWIVSRTGIRERRLVAEGQATSDMAIAAINQLFNDTGVTADEIDIIIVATVTPDYMFPATAALIQKEIGANRAWGFDLSAACSGFLFALQTGASFIESRTAKKVLVVGADTMSAITDYTDRNTCILFGDAAGVVLLEPTEDENYGLIDQMLYVDGSGADALYQAAGGSRLPASAETVAKRQHFIYQDGRTVFKKAAEGMASASTAILNRNNISGDDIAIFVPHQANKRIIDVAAQRMGLSPDKVLLNIDKYGNTTAATIPVGLKEAVEDGRLKDGDYAVLAAFGAGYTWGSILLKWGPTRSK
ncbi:MAG: ketoacyl-ACP synthase III [Candidatus Marinimicrobia bacterium]|nr:ketoacyl-ACP synthase III [Candidatus Neomarinimicrobiota bacterium]MCF7839418.1 ketoacyl-ACP synthase III [Candidatus Neomarinimicrobiota bacterium]